MAVAAWAVPAAAAHAAQIPVPRAAPVVAGPTAGGLTLRAFVDHGRLCTLVDGQAGEYGQGTDGRRHAVDSRQDCGPIPVLGPFGH
ncbi:MAG: hypothetical protein QOK49_358 [Baekduia sp.]|nr:hypothetical protein [Baekduia sp.]